MNIESWLKDKIYIRREDGRNYQTGQPTYSDAFSVKCRREKKQEIVKNIEGEEVVSTDELVVLADIEIKDKIFFNEEDTDDLNKGKSIINFEAAESKSGNIKLWTVYL